MSEQTDLRVGEWVVLKQHPSPEPCVLSEIVEEEAIIVDRHGVVLKVALTDLKRHSE